jgi:hypothetical protein
MAATINATPSATAARSRLRARNAPIPPPRAMPVRKLATITPKA